MTNRTHARRQFRRALAMLCAMPGQPPYAPPCLLSRYIEGLRWRDLCQADSECERLSQWMRWPGERPLEFVAAETGWQLLLRTEMACDFCSDRTSWSKSFDWALPEADIHTRILIDLWRCDALFWARRRYPRDAWCTYPGQHIPPVPL